MVEVEIDITEVEADNFPMNFGDIYLVDIKYGGKNIVIVTKERALFFSSGGSITHSSHGYLTDGSVTLLENITNKVKITFERQ